MTATPAQVAHYASLAAQAEQHVAGLGLDALIDAGRALRQEQIKARRQQLERIAGLTWGDVACAIRALGMPEASEDFVRVCRALHHVVNERGFDNADELLQSLDIAAECVEELRMPEPLSEREQAEADAMDRAERRFEEARDGL